MGCVPQCGFSVAAANLYSGRIITAGTLIAVFISTSDEALPILISEPEHLPLVFLLIGAKIAIAILAGFLFDLIPGFPRLNVAVDENHIHEDCHTGGQMKDILLDACKHTIYIAVFIALVMLALNFAIYFIGEDQLSSLLMSNHLLQPSIAALFGLIPNCAPSIILTELYLSGSLSFGSLLAGLITGAGMGLVVLFRSNRQVKQNLLILLFLFAVGAISGTLIQLFF